MKTIPAILLIELAVAFHSPCSFAEANPQAQVTTKKDFLVIYRPGPGWLKGKPLAEQPLREHGKYMLSLYAKGSMKMAGPLTDDAGGAVVLAVESEAEATDIVRDDPAVKSGIFVYEMHPWELKPWDKYIKNN